MINQQHLTGLGTMRWCFTLVSVFLLSFSGLSQCPNLIVNPDFEQDNTNFTSGYAYQQPAPNAVWDPQTYTVAPNATAVHDNFIGVDHTSGNGMFLIANGSEEELDVWCQQVRNIETNTNYTLSVWLSTLNDLPPSTIQFTVNGQKIGDPFTGPDGANTWLNYPVIWNSGNNTVVDLCIVSFNNTAVENGNDFGLDDLSMTCCITEIDAGPDMAICRGSSAQLSASEGADSYVWSPAGDLDDPSKREPTATPVQTTTYIVKAKKGNCEAIDSVTIIVNFVEATISLDTAICLGESVQLVATGGDAYSWNPIEWLSNPTNATPTATPEKTITYTVIVEKNNCADEKSVTINLKEVNADAGEDREVCNKGEIQLEAKGGKEYLWSPAAWLSETEIANPICNPKQTTTYIVYINDGLCKGVDTVTVFVRKVASRFLADSVCLGLSTNFLNLSTGSDSTLLSWKWDFGDGDKSEEKHPQHVFDAEGTHQVKLITSLGKCEIERGQDIVVHPKPFADFDADQWKGTSDFPSFTFFDLSEGGVKGTWEFNDGSVTEAYVPGENITHVFGEAKDQKGPYLFDVTLQIENEFGCIADTIHTVEIEPIWAFFVPNVFTPDNDGINDFFMPIGEGIDEFELLIFNRWGELVFKSNDFDEGWDGLGRNGKLNDSGVYNWVIDFKNNFGDEKRYYGHVSLLR